MSKEILDLSKGNLTAESITAWKNEIKSDYKDRLIDLMKYQKTIVAQKINADNSLPVTERRARLQELANRARTELTQTLGAEAADAYAQRAAWLSLLQNGVAFATTPKDSPVQVGLGGSSVYPVLPAGVTSNMRQSVNISSSSGFLSAPGSGTTGFIVAPAGQATPSTNTMQVISVTTSSQGGTTTTTTTTSGTPPPRQ